MAFFSTTLSLLRRSNLSLLRNTTRIMSSSHKISRFPIPDKNSLPDDLRGRIDEVYEKTGFIPNVFLAFAHRPDEMRAFIQYYDVLMERDAGLSMAEKELIVVATSAYNNCSYCVLAHSAIHRIISKTPLVADQVAINWQCADISQREKAILHFALKVAKSDAILDEDFIELEKQGLSMEDGWDIAAMASFFALSNRMAHTMKLRANDEFHVLGRVKKEKKN